MARGRGPYFPSDDKWIARERDSLGIDAVEVFQEDEAGRYRKRTSTLDREIQTPNGCQQAIIFATSKAVKNCESLQCSNLFPAEFLSVTSEDLNGGFGCQYHDNAEPCSFSHDSWSYFKIKQISKIPNLVGISYCWMQIAMFVRRNSENHIQFVLFLDCPPELETQLQDLLPSISKTNPYAWHTAFVNGIKHLYDHSIWSLRDLVRKVELARSTTENFQHDFSRLHDISRHIIHSNETLEVARDTVQSMMHEHTLLNQEYPDPSNAELRSSKQIHWDLYSISKNLNALKTRSVSLNERLQNEINLAFNIVAQRNSEVSVQIGENARSDNAMMKTVAVVSLLYLPGTFVSGLFGMNFFDFSPRNNSDTQIWTISENFWLYWAITIPLTIATIAIWALRHYYGSILRVSRKA